MTLKICNSQQPRGSLLERPSETLDGRPTPAVKNKEGFLPCKAAKEPWKQKALRLGGLFVYRCPLSESYDTDANRTLPYGSVTTISLKSHGPSVKLVDLEEFPIRTLML